MKKTLISNIQKAQDEIKSGNINNATIFIDDYLSAVIDNPVAWDIKAQILYIEISTGQRLFRDLYNLYKYIKTDILFVKQTRSDATMDELIVKTAITMYETCCALIHEQKEVKRNNEKKLNGSFILQIIGLLFRFGHHRGEHVVGNILSQKANSNISKISATNQHIDVNNKALHQLKDDIRKFIPNLIDDTLQSQLLLSQIDTIERKYQT